MKRHKNTDIDSKNEKMRNNIPSFELASNAPLASDDYIDTVGAIFSAISNACNVNIGLIGGFGSGKSSAIESYIKENNKLENKDSLKKNILKISLANYSTSEDVEEKHLQLAIIEQFLYSIKTYKIPSSSFCRRGVKPAFISLLFWFVILFIFSIPSIVSIYVDNYFKPFAWIPLSLSFLAIIISLLFCTQNLKVKAKIKDLEVELSSNNINNNRNLFDMFLDDIVYFFKKSKYDLIIFEDIDRYKKYCEELFTKLSALNKLVNNVPEIKRKRIVRFMYAVREDIFDGEKKSKFFDILIPIKPILSINNAYNRLCAILGDFKDKFSDDFLRLVALNFKYVRQINNVVNAFKILTNNQDYSKNKNEYLFAALLYKHLFPTDFIDHLRGEGIITILILPHSDDLKKQTSKIDWATFTNNITFLDSKKEPEDFKKILNFYFTLEKYLNDTSFAMLTNYPKDGLSDNDRFFVSSILANNNDEDFSYNIDSVNHVLKEISNVKAVFSRTPFYNFKLLLAIIDNKEYDSIYQSFVNEFKTTNYIAIRFVNEALNKAVKGDDKLTIFLKDISKLYPILQNYIENGGLNKEDILVFLSKQNILNVSNFKIQNVNQTIENIINDSLNPCSILRYMNGDLLNLLKDNPCSLKLKYFYKTDLSSVVLFKTIDYVIDNILFLNSQDNFNFIHEYKKNTCDESGFFSVLLSLNEKTYNYFKTNANFISDGKPSSYENENPKLLMKALSELSIEKDFVIEILKTCPIMVYSENIVINYNIIEAYFAGKVSLDANHLSLFISSTSTKSRNDFLKIIISNPNLLIENRDLSSSGKEIAFSILNMQECRYEIAGKILEKCFTQLSIDYALFNVESDTFICALEYCYFKCDSNLLNIVYQNEKLFCKFVKAYKVFLCDENNSSSFTSYKFIQAARPYLSNEEYNMLLTKHAAIVRNTCDDPQPLISFYVENKNLINKDIAKAISSLIKQINSKAISFLCLGFKNEFFTNEDIVSIFINNMAVGAKLSFNASTDVSDVLKELKKSGSFSGRDGSKTISITRKK